ncbi:MAG: alkaline phosphatase [Pseudomonadales bacterium]|nr:alkaline phosphatase [Pseudomonadales bacterium]
MRTNLAHAIGFAACITASQSALPQETPQGWFDAGQETVARNLALRSAQTDGIARNVILFVGDGMGVSTVTAARIFEGQLRGETGEENLLSFETFPSLALSKTYNTNAQVADSAGTMSAMATGIKTKAGLISVNQNVIRGDCDSQAGNQTLTFLERAEMRGLSTGVVTTARLTHATPAANYAHIMDRDFEDDADAARLAFPGDCVDIARQLIEFGSKTLGSDGLEVAMGGGRASFIPQAVTDPESGRSGNRLDGRDLTEEWVALEPNSHYVWNKQQFDAIDPASTDHLLGLFQPSHMQYELDRPQDAAGEPDLSDMTAKAIDILAKNSNGYFLQVESGRIDHGHHATSPIRALTDAIEFSNAIRTAVERVDLSETLIIVTADHSHVFTIAGYPKRGNPILGKSVGLDAAGNPLEEPSLAADGLPYTTLSYANGEPASFGGQPLPLTEYRRPNLTNVDTTDRSFRPEVTVPMGSETHGGEDVAIYAIGPGSDLIRGVMEQNVIFHVMMEASQLSQR